MYLEEHKHSFNVRPDPLGRALTAARRAVELDPANQLAYFALATANFFLKDFDGFRLAAERALALNPLDGNTKGWMGLLIAYAGDWERGVALAAEAMTLNPHHPGWYHFGSFWNHYRKGEYPQALECVRKINMPSYFYWHAALAATYGRLGRVEEARRAAGELLKLYPDYSAKAREELAKWLGPEMVEHFIEGLRKAGLEIPPAERTAPAAGQAQPESPARGALGARAAEKSIAVLPFHNLSGDPEQEYFADGITEEIINTLTTVPGLRVIARTSAFAFKGQSTDIRKIAEVLGVGSVLEGGVRRAGNRIRVTAQLIAAADGSHIWSERYDRQMEDLFALQDEIATAIASEMKLKFAPDPAVRPRRQTNLRAYEVYLRYRQHVFGFTPESLRRSRECLEQAMALDPGFALPYAGLADHYLGSTESGLRPAEAMPKARELAQRALELDPDLPEAHGMLGIVAGPYEWDWKEAERRFLLATAREPVPWHVRLWHTSFYLIPVGRSEEALRQALRVLEDDPLSPINSMVLALVYEGLGREAEANAAYRKVLELDPHFWWGWLQFGLHHAVHGRHAEARECAERAFAIYPAAPPSLACRRGC
jgi:TolB-like protein/Flp pilus assembly protein TadD